jgi:hypothetical protein
LAENGAELTRGEEQQPNEQYAPGRLEARLGEERWQEARAERGSAMTTSPIAIRMAANIQLGTFLAC